MNNEINKSQLLTIAAFATLVLAFRCGSDDEPMPTDPDSGTITDAGVSDGGMPMLGTVNPHFVSPADHTEVPQGTIFKFTTSGVQIVPRSMIDNVGEGYFVLSIDASCVATNMIAPMDAKHIHLLDGETEIALSLPEGMHQLCLQVAWADGRVFDGRARFTTYMF
jgi:hypothetical protein